MIVYKIVRDLGRGIYISALASKFNLPAFIKSHGKIIRLEGIPWPTVVYGLNKHVHCPYGKGLYCFEDYMVARYYLQQWNRTDRAVHRQKYSQYRILKVRGINQVDLSDFWKEMSPKSTVIFRTVYPFELII